MDEVAQIKKRYQDRKNSTGGRYSLFNRGNLFILQQRERVLLQLLEKHGKKKSPIIKYWRWAAGRDFGLES